MISFSDITNGSHWEAPWPQCWIAEVQWLNEDQWVLLVGDERDNPRMTHQMKFSDGWKIIVTKAEMQEYLNRLPWHRLGPRA